MNQLEKSPHEHTKKYTRRSTPTHTSAKYIQRDRANEHEHELDHGQQDTPKRNQTAGHRNQRQAKGTNDQGREQDQGQPTAPEDTRTTGRIFTRFYTLFFSCWFFFTGSSSFFFTFQSTTITTGLVIS